LDFPELIVARVELSSKGKLVYLRMEGSATEVLFKVELVHWVMDDPNAKENLLRRMNRVTRDRDPPEKFGTEIKLGESQFTLKTIIRVLGINERHVRRLYRESFI
jgi:AraC-like DNA-binding protein